MHAVRIQPAYFDEGEAGVLCQLRSQSRLAGVGASLEQDGDQTGAVSRRRLSEYEIRLERNSDSNSSIDIIDYLIKMEVFQTHLINEERSVVEDVLHRLSPVDDPSTKHSLNKRKVLS